MIMIFQFSKLYISRYLLAVFVVPAIILALSSPVFAGFPEDVAALNAKSYSAKIKATRNLAANNGEKAVPVLQALLNGDLFIIKADKSLVIGVKQGSVYLLSDPVTGASLGEAPKTALKKVRINNRLRGVLKSTLGSLTLLSPDPEKRANAADAVFKSASKDMAPLLEQALKRETDANARARMELALAAIQIKTSKEAEVILRAIESLSGNSTQDVRSLLGQAAQDESNAPEVRASASKALSDIEDRLALWNLVGSVFQGISLGSVLLLAAVGLAITFGVMGVINMAHGELVMLGAYTTYMIQEAFRAYMPGAFDYSLFVAVPAAFMVSGCVGIAIERGIIRFLYGRPLETLLATWGLSLILQQAVRTIFGPTNREVGAPSWMSGAIETTSGLVLTYNRITIIVFSLIVLAIIALILRKTAFGLQMRAVTQNRRMAGSMGIKTGAVDALTFGLGSGVAGVAGVALSQIDNVSPNLGQAYIIDSFMVVVFGGVGNLWGTLVGAFSLGIVNKFLEPVSGAVLAKILVLVAIILFIQKRPRGLFALKGRAVEA